MLQLKQWKRGTTTYRELKRLGAPEDVALEVAVNSRHWWKNAGKKLSIVLTTKYYEKLGMPRLAR